MPEKDDCLRMLLGVGKPIEFVAAELKRSAKAVMGRASNIAQTQTEAESEGGMTMRFTDSRSYQLFGSRFCSK
jgi:hypothetical protein